MIDDDRPKVAMAGTHRRFHAQETAEADARPPAPRGTCKPRTTVALFTMVTLLGRAGASAVSGSAWSPGKISPRISR